MGRKRFPSTPSLKKYSAADARDGTYAHNSRFIRIPVKQWMNRSLKKYLTWYNEIDRLFQ